MRGIPGELRDVMSNWLVVVYKDVGKLVMLLVLICCAVPDISSQLEMF